MTMATRELDRGSSTATPLNVTYRVHRISKYLWGDSLDFGGADGGYDQEMMARGLEAVSGVDVEESRIEEARLRDLPNAQYTTFDGRMLPFADRTFDGVLMNEVFEHVADEERALSEVFRVVKPGGFLVLVSPNRWFPVDGHFITVGSRSIGPAPLVPWLPKRLTRYVTSARNYWPRVLESQVQRVGFAIDNVEFVWPVMELLPWLPQKSVAWYRRNFRKWDHTPGLRRFGLSTMVVGVRPAGATRC